MVAPLDIFKTDKFGNVFLCGQAASLDDAKAKVQMLAMTGKAKYTIFSSMTGNSVVIRPRGSFNREWALR
jgi:hypothetical protein